MEHYQNAAMNSGNRNLSPNTRVTSRHLLLNSPFFQGNAERPMSQAGGRLEDRNEPDRDVACGQAQPPDVAFQ
jgi:hypothetical protein